MKIRIFLTAALSVSLTVLSLPTTSVAAERPADLGENAALDYWQAIYRIAMWSETQKKTIENSETISLDKAAVNAVEVGTRPLVYLRYGAKRPFCDWGLHVDDTGSKTLLPFLSYSRVLAHLAILRGRLEIRDGHGPDAADDWAAVLALGRHIEGDFAVSMLVGFGVETMLIETAAPDLNRLDAASLEHLSKLIDSLPTGGSMTTAIRSDQRMDKVEVRMLQGIKDDPQWEQAASKWLGEGLNPEELRKTTERFHAIALASGGTAKSVIDKLTEQEAIYDQAVQVATLPYAQAMQRWPQIDKQWQANPAAADILSGTHNYARLHQIQAVAHARMALFRAAVDVARSGPDAVKNHADPFGSGPFGYRAMPKGFELTSQLLDKEGHAVSVRVGRD